VTRRHGDKGTNRPQGHRTTGPLTTDHGKLSSRRRKGQSAKGIAHYAKGSGPSTRSGGSEGVQGDGSAGNATPISRMASRTVVRTRSAMSRARAVSSRVTSSSSPG